jgi:two-component system response regulator DegU
MDHTIRIVIADDQAFVRTSLRTMLELEPRFRIIAEAKSSSEAIQLVEKHLPDIAVMDISKSVLSGIEATRIITSKFPKTRVIVLTMHIDQNYSDSAYAAGASWFLAKGCEKDDILDAIRDCCSDYT